MRKALVLALSGLIAACALDGACLPAGFPPGVAKAGRLPGLEAMSYQGFTRP